MPRIALLCAFLFALTSVPDATAQRAACEGGFVQPAGSSTSFACNSVDFLGNVSIGQMSGNGANDIWGWTDPESGDEYALVGLANGTGFVNVTDGENPVYLGKLPSHTSSSTWRDVKVYADHAYVVSEAGGHGIQVFDLTQLRDATPGTTFEETAHYDGVGSVHNIAINEDTGFAYAVGSQGGTQSGCSGGLHMVDLSSPAEPAFAGCFSADGYTHDVQCVVYDGPDADYQGREVCVAANADTVTLVDVTDKSAPSLISFGIYSNVGYTHQGWLTEDHRFFIAGDELDEANFSINTRTLVFDVTDLDEPELQGEFFHDTPAIDHNLYIKDQYVYQSNYQSGLRILDASALLAGADDAGLETVAYFDTYPNNDNTGFGGTWSNYPYFASGNVIVNDGSRGLFIVKPLLGSTTDTADTVQPGAFSLSAAYPNPFVSETRFDLRVGDSQAVEVAVYNVLGRQVATLFSGVMAAGEMQTVRLDGADLPAGTYLIRITGESFSETRRVTLAR